MYWGPDGTLSISRRKFWVQRLAHIYPIHLLLTLVFLYAITPFLMPLYMILLVDLARGHGLAARFFSLPGMGILGETGFSIFMWQSFVMVVCWAMAEANPAAGRHQFLWALVWVIAVGIVSTYFLERPVARWLRRKLV